jgi:ADP-heptose:LPS heptosyltransferase
MTRWSHRATDRTAHPASSPLKGRYLATNRALRAAMAGSDLLLAPLRLRRRPALKKPRKLLLSIGGHLGDAVIAMDAVTRLTEVAPGIEIGVLSPSWSSVVFEGDERIAHRHVVNHWYLDRGPANRVQKWLGYRRSRHRAIAEIRAIGYDAAVDLYDYFPNAALLLWRAGIPVRIGFDASGFSALYTHAAPWPPDHRHTADRQVMLLRTLFPEVGTPRAARRILPDPAPGAARHVEQLLLQHRVPVEQFTVVHPGAGSRAKEWPIENWRQVVERLSADGATLVFTGRGAREQEAIRYLSRDLPGCVDLCDQLEWAALVQLIRLARRVISVDTVAAHIAGAVGTPATTLWTSPSDPDHWRPLGSATVVVGDPVGAAERSAGATSGVRDIPVSDVIAALSSAPHAQVLVPAAVRTAH